LDNINFNISVVSERLHRIRLSQESLKRGNETLGFTKGEEFLDYLNDSWLCYVSPKHSYVELNHWRTTPGSQVTVANKFCTVTYICGTLF
jgi:hypothetical protein